MSQHGSMCLRFVCTDRQELTERCQKLELWMRIVCFPAEPAFVSRSESLYIQWEMEVSIICGMAGIIFKPRRLIIDWCNQYQWVHYSSISCQQSVSMFLMLEAVWGKQCDQSISCPSYHFGQIWSCDCQETGVEKLMTKGTIFQLCTV